MAFNWVENPHLLKKIFKNLLMKLYQ